MSSTRPPGPRSRLLTTYRLLARPLQSMPAWRERYGDPMWLPTINGNAVMTAEPALIREIFAANPTHYSPGAVQALSRIVGPGSLLVLSGDRHRRERKLLVPPFHGARMRHYAQIMRAVAVETLAAASAQEQVSFHHLAQQISMEVIVRAVFGAQEKEQVRAINRLIMDMVTATRPGFFFAPFLQRELWGLGPWAQFRRTYERLDAVLQQQIERRRHTPGEDILSLLVQARYDDGQPMADTDIRDQLRTLLFAGHETTAIALSWAVDAIGRHPQVAARMRTELAALDPDTDAETLAGINYVDCVAKETLRLYPIITEVLRTLVAPMSLGDYELEPGVMVAASVLMAHRHPEIYPKPEAFVPERFESQKYSPFEYLPFGGGHRRCLGAAFASFEMNIVLATAFAGWEIELVNEKPPRPVRRNVTLAPHDGVPVRVRRLSGKARSQPALSIRAQARCA